MLNHFYAIVLNHLLYYSTQPFLIYYSSQSFLVAIAYGAAQSFCKMNEQRRRREGQDAVQVGEVRRWEA
jgi:hypothetical protein